MKNHIDFNFRFNGYWPLDFINCFSSVMNFEGVHEDQGKLYFLYDTMCGHNSLRSRNDGLPNEMQKRLGYNYEDDSGNDYTVDFLFGFTGYEYRKLTESGDFNAAIAASIDTGKPVIGKVKTGTWRCRVISGYDGDKLIEANYKDIGHNPPEKTVEYDELEALYILGEKTQPRYTLKNGFERIRQVMEYNMTEKPWNSWIEKMSGESFRNADIEEKQSRMKTTGDRMWDMNGYAFACAFDHRIHEELQNPALDGICKQIRDIYFPMCEYYWSLIGLAACAKWDHHAFRCGDIGAMVKLTLERIQNNDEQVLEIIKQAIEILDK